MIETMTALQASRRLRDEGMKISADTIRLGIEQEQFPFGNVIISKTGRPICLVYAKLLEQWIDHRQR